MGLFSFFKKKNVTEPRIPESPKSWFTEQSPIIKKQQAILDDDTKSLDERNAAYLAIREEEVRRLNAAYNFKTIEGINSIPVPCCEVNGGSVTGRVEYYLRGMCFAQHWEAGRTELALACLKKAQDLMYISSIRWQRRDFMRLVNYLHKAGKHREADYELKRLNDYFNSKDDTSDALIRCKKDAQSWGTDLVEAVDVGVCCAKCAAYRRRIYSISGKDRRFPKLPGDYHIDCGLMLYPYTELMPPSFPCHDVVQYSNRPFVDDRSIEEKARYEAWIAARREDEAAERRREQNRIELFWLDEHFPDICPKSLSAYSRMKNANSKNFQVLVEKAATLGYEITK